MVDMRQRSHDEIAQLLDQKMNMTEMTPEMKMMEDNLDFEKNILENPVPKGIGPVNVFGYETWDINMILKGNYWGRSIYTTDKICKLFLKWNLERQKKYLRKKNVMDFDWTWILLLMLFIGGGVLLALFLLPTLLGGI